MKLAAPPLLGANLDRSDISMKLICWAIAALVILPNLLLFSVDDIIIVSLTDPLKSVALDQASNGRYGLSALCWLLRILGGSRIDLEAIGAVTIIVGYAALFSETIRFSRARFSTAEYLAGFSIFLTFGLLMDVFSFTNVWVQSGAASLALAASLNITQSERRFASKISIIGLVGCVAMGFYQTYPYMVACSLMAAFVISFAFGDGETLSTIVHRYLPAAVGALIAVGLYLVTNKILQGAGVPGFSAGGRPFGAEYLKPNVLPYIKTIGDALNAFSGGYAHYENRITIIVFGLAVVTAVSAAKSLRAKVLVIFAFFAVALMLPNPTNLLMKIYWPSPRSLSPISIFVALIITAACARWTGKIAGVSIGMVALLITVLSQAVIYIDQQKGRADQEAMDIATANMIINRAYQEFPYTKRPVVKMNFNWDDNVIYHARTFEFGESLMTTPENRKGLFLYLSNGRVDVYPTSPSECSGIRSHLTIEVKGDALLVCSNK
ncbi:TPA: hypothetical protein QDA98_004617 [Burkholderia vietnamiensis]|nr:hypothetical protein [Burkholderia vietnamiensis]